MLMSVALIMEAASLAATIQSPHTTVHVAQGTGWQLINTPVRTSMNARHSPISAQVKTDWNDTMSIVITDT